MVRIAGVVISTEKRILISLTYIFGIGRTKSTQILKKTGVDENKRTKDLTEEEITKLRDAIVKTEKVEGDLKREIQGNIKRLKEIGSYRGTRHAKGLPARGQRTKTNSRTVRGNVRKTAGSGKKLTGQKT
ncbi:MAG: 30S ribosomal protein S13 [Candidatus Falkowbacteria bacterium]|nr:30S ribosomal protein S13 [Candidatus Falkowbacteria bacterium]